MSWRPENWENKYDKEEWHTEVDWQLEDLAIAYEAGADAMLEALKEGGYRTEYIPTSEMAKNTGKLKFGKGWLAFIPDE